MKYKIYFVFVLTVLFFQSCSSDDDQNAESDEGTLHCTINNETKSTNIVTITNIDLSNNQVGTQIYATFANPMAGLQIVFTGSGTGVWTMNHTDINPVFGTYSTTSPLQGWASTASFDPGTLTITENTSTHMSGSFDFYVKTSFNSPSLHLVGSFNKIAK